MNTSLVKAENKNELIVSPELSASLVEEKFASVLKTFTVDITNSNYKNILAFNRVFNREHVQFEYYPTRDYSYISDISSDMLADNNIARGREKARPINPVVYAVIDNSVEDITEHLKPYVYEQFALRIYINIPEYKIYTSVEAFINEYYPQAEIISINNAPKTFDANLHYYHQIPKTHIPWEHTFPRRTNDKLPYLTFNRFGDTVPKSDTCIHALLDKEEFLTEPRVAEVVGTRAATLVLDWNPDIKTIKEYIDDCASIRSYPVFYRHFTRFVGALTAVDLEIDYIRDVLGTQEPAKRQYNKQKKLAGFKIEEPSVEQIRQALQKSVYYSKERLCIISGQLCYVENIKPKYHMVIHDKIYFSGQIDIEETQSLSIEFITPLHGGAYKALTKLDHLVLPDNIRYYLERINGFGTGWWSKHNIGHQDTLNALLKLYSLDKLIALKMYSPTDGFSSQTYTLDMKHTRWFE